MRPNPNRKYRWVLGVIILLILLYQFFRPLPNAAATNNTPQPLKTTASALPWPSGGQAAIGAAGYGLLASHNTVSAVPIGSTAKIITALAVLQQKPLATGSQGPTLTLTQADVDSFNSYYSQNGSVTNVAAGEQITEYQALESLLIPSSNNMADTLAAWAFGSKEAYLQYANRMVKKMSLTHTTVGDTNGFSDATTSTADDLVRLALAAMENPAIAKVVNESTTQIPVEGPIKNTNFLLGSHGIIGIKTGNTEKAGGCYVFASEQTVSGRQVTIIGAILNQPTLADAIGAAPALIDASAGNFVSETLIHKDQQIAVYKTPWGAAARAIAEKDATLLVWKGQAVNVSSHAAQLQATAAKGSRAGSVTVSEGQLQASSPLVLSDNLSGPSWFWRLTRH
jgi:D-alanyl-D-alanine carboxypeptidase (penicillin-binding protein 5/6)